MPLKIELKPNERVILGDCVVTNDDQRTRLLIQGTVPVLREKDIMTPSRANTPAERIYLAIQIMYVEKSAGPPGALYAARARNPESCARSAALH